MRRFALSFLFLQFVAAIADFGLYGTNYDGLTKDYRWNFAITTCAFSTTVVIIHAVLVGYFYFPESLEAAGYDTRTYDWILFSGICSGILFLFWTGVLGTFATSFINLDPNENNGVRMMRIAVYFDAANMVIWFLTVVYTIVIAESYRATNPPPRMNRRPWSTAFVPHGWDPADIEAQLAETLARRGSGETGNPQPPSMVGTYAAHRSIPNPSLPVYLQPIITIASDPNVTRFGDMERARPVSERLSSLITSGEPTKECPLCAEERPCWTGFPSRIASACSSHEQVACRDCIARSIAAEIDTNISGQIHCFECRALLAYQEVKYFATPATFERYEAMGLRSFVNNDPNFVWCQSRDCPAGQEHVGGVDQPIVTCQACGFRTCFKHQIPWHEEMLCDEYDQRLPISDNERRIRAQQELASIAAVHKLTRPCANDKCKAPIQKNKGCDHMTCGACKYEFCWVCGTNWNGIHRHRCGHR